MHRFRESVADIERTVDTNVTAVIHMTRLVLPGMIERGRGHIVNMSSIRGMAAKTRARQAGAHSRRGRRSLPLASRPGKQNPIGTMAIRFVS